MDIVVVAHGTSGSVGRVLGNRYVESRCSFFVFKLASRYEVYLLLYTCADVPTKFRTPIWGYLMRTPCLFYLDYTVPDSIPSRPNHRRINVEYFQAQHPSRANQPRTFTRDSIQARVTP